MKYCKKIQPERISSDLIGAIIEMLLESKKIASSVFTIKLMFFKLSTITLINKTNLSIYLYF